MEREEFEAALFEFVCGENYRQAEEALLALVRAAFAAGWCAARYPSGPEGETTAPR